MATSASPVRVVLLGLPPSHAFIPVHIQPLIAKSLEDTGTQFADAGYKYEFIPVSPEDGLAALGPKLQSQCPDAVVIGNGIRAQLELTHFLEQIIDLVRTSAPQAKLLFNTKPDNTIDAVKRWFPNAEKSL